jgi:hypothetical protein
MVGGSGWWVRREGGDGEQGDKEPLCKELYACVAAEYKPSESTGLLPLFPFTRQKHAFPVLHSAEECNSQANTNDSIRPLLPLHHPVLRRVLTNRDWH